MGGILSSIRSWARGSCGARNGAKTAASTTIRSHPAESHRRRFRRRPRVRGPECTGFIVVSAMTQPRVQKGVGQIDSQIHQDEDAGKRQDDTLYQWKVAVDDGVDRHIAQAFVGEQALDYDGTTYQKRKLHADERKCRQGRITKRLAEDHLNFREAAHTCKNRIVLFQHFL